MRKIFAPLLVGLAFILFSGTKGNRPAVVAPPQTYFITAPEGWTQKDTMIEGIKRTEIMAPDGKENISVYGEAAGGYDSKTYGEASIEEIKKQTPGVEITDFGKKTLGDLTAECYIYTFNYNGYDLKDLAWYVAKNDFGYVITCTAFKSTFDLFEPKFKACASTFIIK